MLRPLLLAAALVAAPAALAQSQRTLPDDDWCKEDDGYGRQEHACEVREFVFPATALDLDPGQNGGVAVRVWDRADVLVRAKVYAQAETGAEARRLLSATRVTAGGGRVRASFPDGSRDGWASVSYEVFAPARTDLAVTTHNGGVSVKGIRGTIGVEAMNGGIALQEVGGTVKAHTVNGGISIALAGGTWQGDGLDAESTNGGISIRLPEDYSAELEVSTQMGRISAPDLSVRNATHSSSSSESRTNGRRKDWSFGDEVRGTLGQGGPLVRAVTRNGGISITQGD